MTKIRIEEEGKTLHITTYTKQKVNESDFEGSVNWNISHPIDAVTEKDIQVFADMIRETFVIQIRDTKRNFGKPRTHP